MSSGTRCTYLAFPGPAPFEHSPAADGYFHPACGIHTSYRQHRYLSASADTAHYFKFDFVTAQNVDYLFIARADCITDLSDIELYHSDDDITYTLDQTWSAPFTFTGVRDNDFLACFTPTGTHRYWRVNFTLGTSQVLEFSKLYLGELFDMGKEPSLPFREQRINESSLRLLRSTSQNVHRARREEFTYRYDVVFEGVPNSVCGAFMDRVEYFYDRFALLINTDYGELLNNHEVLHGRITRPTISGDYPNYATVNFTYTEMEG